MATSIWKGHLTFGLVSVPVKLSRAARAEKVAFRQMHEATGTRVRQALYREPQESLEVGALGDYAAEAEIPRLPKKEKANPSDTVLSFPASATALEVSRNELAKGYEYEPGRYLVLSREEVDSITPATAHEMQILEFVKLAEVDPVYFETS
jgi:DNA end-binding protein Ku